MSMNAAAMRMLVDRGFTGEDLIALALCLEKAFPVDTAHEKRKAYDRQRKRDQRANSTGHSTGNPPDPAPNEIDILTPTRKEKPKPNGLVKKPDRGSRLADDWEPQPLIGKAAEMVAAWQPGQLERELAKFKNYWPSKGANAARTDWQRTWVNWLIAADERKPRLIHERSDNPLGDAVSRILRTG